MSRVTNLNQLSRVQHMCIRQTNLHIVSDRCLEMTIHNPGLPRRVTMAQRKVRFAVPPQKIMGVPRRPTKNYPSTSSMVPTNLMLQKACLKTRRRPAKDLSTHPCRLAIGCPVPAPRCQGPIACGSTVHVQLYVMVLRDLAYSPEHV